MLSLKYKKNLSINLNKESYLKILTENDFSKDYLNWMKDYEITKFTEQSDVSHNTQNLKKFVKEKLISSSDLLFGIYVQSKHIGNIKLGPISWKHLSSDVSYIIGNKEFWNKGIATLAVSKIVEFGFKELGLKKINAGYYENNIGSKRVLSKCGFIVEGIRKNEILFENKRINQILVGISCEKDDV